MVPRSLPLMGRSGTSRRSGRLVVGVTILEKRQYKEVGNRKAAEQLNRKRPAYGG